MIRRMHGDGEVRKGSEMIMGGVLQEEGSVMGRPKMMQPVGC